MEGWCAAAWLYPSPSSPSCRRWSTISGHVRWTARLRRRLRWSSWITSNQLGSTDNLARKCGVVLAGRATTQTIARRHIMRSSTGHCLFVFDRLILLDVGFYQHVNNCSRQVGRCGTSQPPQSYPCDRGGTQHG